MANFEKVTFGGSNLDRAAELRNDPNVMAGFLADPNTRAVVLWRGKLLISGEENKSLVHMRLEEPMFKHALEAPIFLGRNEGQPLFAFDISKWEPEAQDLPDDGFLDQSVQHFPGCPEDTVFRELRSVMTHLSARDAEVAATARSLFEWHKMHRFCSTCGHESDVAHQGWQRNCPSCGRMHFPRTDPVVIMLITHGNKVLVGRGAGWPEGMYSLLAGFVEPGETPEAAVRREVFEEAGVPVGKVRYLGSQPWAFPSSLMLGFAGEALDTKISIDPNEIEEAFWLSREEMMSVFAESHPVMRRPRNGAIAHYILKNWLEDCLD